MKTYIIIAIFYAITGLTAIFWYAKYQLKKKEYEDLLNKIKQQGMTQKERVVLMEMVEIVRNYKFNPENTDINAYTEMNKLKEIVYSLDKKIALDSDQTN